MQRNNLPPNWSWVKLGDTVGHHGIFVDGDWVESKDQDPNGEVRLIQLADIGENSFRNRSNRFLTYDKAVDLNCTFLSKNDLLIARMPDPLGRACLFPYDVTNKFVTVVDVAIVRCDKEFINPKFLCYVVNAPQSRSNISALQSGSTRKRISRKNLATINFPLPPLPEQHRIVEKIEELFSELDNGIENLKKAKEQIKTYRQAVLKSAFEGRLTAEDRSQKSESRSKNGELPDGWELKTVDDISEKIVDCLHSTPKFQVSGRYCVDTTCIKNGQILYDKIRFVSEATFNDRVRRLKPQHGDILFAREGTVGTALIVPPEIELCLGQRMMMFRPRKDILSKYFMYSLQSTKFVKQYKPLIGGTTAPHLNIRDIKKFQIPVCSTQQQAQTVEEIERRFSVADKMEAAIDESLKKAEALKQSILKQAFEGKLVQNSVL